MRKVRVLLGLIIITLILLPGCSVNEKADSSGSTIEDNLAITTSLLHGSPGGVWFMLGTAISECLDKSYPGSIMHVNPGQSAANNYRLNNNETEFSLTHSSLAYEATNGLGQYEEKLNNIAGVAVFYSSPLQFVVRTNTGVKTFDDFIENKIPLKLSLSSKSGNSEVAFYNLVAEYGLTKDDLEGWGCELYSISLSDSADAFNDGIVDGLFIMASVPTPTLIKMGTNDEVTMVSISEEKIEAMAKNHGFNKFVVPAGSYTYQTEDISSFNTYTMICASLDTSLEHVYKVTKSLVENIEYLKTIHSALEEISVESFFINMGIPMHPGAERYYLEIGLID